jgi:hypothetical protein
MPMGSRLAENLLVKTITMVGDMPTHHTVVLDGLLCGPPLHWEKRSDEVTSVECMQWIHPKIGVTQEEEHVQLSEPWNNRVKKIIIGKF